MRQYLICGILSWNFVGPVRLTNRTFFQYYGLAIFTVLFYDYLLTLEDEVCRDATPRGRVSSLKLLLEDRVFLAWKEDMECACFQQ